MRAVLLGCLLLSLPRLAHAAAPPRPADLAVDPPVVQPEVVRPGDPLEVSITVRNSGNTEAAPTRTCVRWAIDGVEVGDFATLDTVALGGFSVATFSVTATVPAARALEVVAYADCFHVVAEPDEQDNRRAAPVVLDGTTPLEMRVQVLPPGAVGALYEARLVALGGTLPRQFTVSGLPPGLVAHADGRIDGVPTQAGPFTGWADVVDGAGATAGAAVEVTIATAEGPPTIVAPALRAATVGREYCADEVTQFLVAGGRAPYVWSALQLPAGLALSASGELCGVALGPPGVEPVSVRVEDADRQLAEANLRMTVGPSEPLAVDTPELPMGMLGEPYEAVVRARGGTPPYTFRMETGVLQDGLVLEADGRVHGTPTMTARRNVRIGVVDAADATAIKAFVLVVDQVRPPLFGGADPDSCGCGVTDAGSGGLAWVVLGGVLVLARRRH